MFNIRDIQEHVIFEAVRKQSDAKTADEIAYGEDKRAKGEANADWKANLTKKPQSKSV